jgi:hypothetical protein
MIGTTLYSTVLLATAALAAVVDIEARYEHGSCSFQASHKQLCSPSSPQGPINYIAIGAIRDGANNVIVDARTQRPLAQFNSYTNLNKAPWRIRGFDKGGLVVTLPREQFLTESGFQRQEVLDAAGGDEDDDTIVFKYADLEWTTLDSQTQRKDAWCNVQPWDQEDWKCSNGQLVDPPTTCTTDPCSVDKAHDSLRERQMECFFTC